MFHFPAYPPDKSGAGPYGRRVPPFGNPRIKALSAAPRGLSRPHTSFIGTVCQGIHHTPQHPQTTNAHSARTTTQKTTSRSNRSIHPKNSLEQSQHKQNKPYGLPRSRPLSSSQTTTPHTARPNQPARGTPCGSDHVSRPGNPTACTGHKNSLLPFSTPAPRTVHHHGRAIRGPKISVERR